MFNFSFGFTILVVILKNGWFHVASVIVQLLNLNSLWFIDETFPSSLCVLLGSFSVPSWHCCSVKTNEFSLLLKRLKLLASLLMLSGLVHRTWQLGLLAQPAARELMTRSVSSLITADASCQHMSITLRPVVLFFYFAVLQIGQRCLTAGTSLIFPSYFSNNSWPISCPPLRTEPLSG